MMIHASSVYMIKLEDYNFKFWIIICYSAFSLILGTSVLPFNVRCLLVDHQASDAKEYGEDLVGSKIKVWWPQDRA